MFSLSSSKSSLFLNKYLKSVHPLFLFSSQSHSQSSPGHHPSPKIEGRFKVTDKIIWLNIVPMDGVPRRCAAYSGESLLDVILRYRIPGVSATCDGGDKEFKPS